MFSPIVIELKASKSEFWFISGRQECRFRPVIYLSADRRVEAVGVADHPTTNAGIKLFETDGENAFDLLESMLRYGMQSVVGGKLSLGPRHLWIEIHPDIRAQFRGFAVPIFHHVALRSGAAKVTIR